MTFKINTFESEVLHISPPRLRLKYGGELVFDFPLTEHQYNDLQDWDDQDDRDAARRLFVATMFGKLFAWLHTATTSDEVEV